jgi:imidazolonepropionase
LLHNGIVAQVGVTSRIENVAPARRAEVIDASGRVVMPAFIDPHAHLLPVPGNSPSAVKSIPSLPASRLEAQADQLLRTMARHGTATLGALSGHGSTAAGELNILRAYNARHRRPLDIVSILHLNSAIPSAEAPELLNSVFRRKLAAIVAVSCGTEGLPEQAANSLLDAARALGLPVRLEMSLDRPRFLVEAAVGAKALSVSVPGPYEPAEIEMLAASSTVAILTPFHLRGGGGTGSARQLIDNGLLVALGTGLGPAGATASMQTVVQLACERLGMSLPEALSAATVNAAAALGLGSVTGALEHGKWGDLILLNASDYRDIPLLSGTNLTHLMLKRGVLLFEEEFPGWPPRS